MDDDDGLDGDDAAPETPFGVAGSEDQAWHLALSIDVDIELGELTPAFDELADAMLVWVSDSEAAALSDRVLDQVWSPELETAIRAGLERVAGCPGEWCRDAESALADLARNGRSSDIARAFAQRVAMDLSNEDAVSSASAASKSASRRDETASGAASRWRRPTSPDVMPASRRASCGTLSRARCPWALATTAAGSPVTSRPTRAGQPSAPGSIGSPDWGGRACRRSPES